MRPSDQKVGQKPLKQNARGLMCRKFAPRDTRNRY